MTANTVSEHEAQARDRFDQWSKSQTFQRLRPWLAFVQSHVLDQIDWPRTTAVLDVACGSGWAVYEAAGRLRANQGGIACGCDISTGMLGKRTSSESDGGATICFTAASAQSLPYAPGSFDAVFCTAAFHHFPVPEGALAEFRRILRAGGTLLIADSCRDQSPGTWVWDRLHRWFERGHVKYYRRQELLDLLEAAGFTQIELVELDPSYRETRKLVRKAALFSARTPGN